MRRGQGTKSACIGQYYLARASGGTMRLPASQRVPTANDRWVSNFDQFFVGRPVTLSLLIILQENLFLNVHMGEKAMIRLVAVAAFALAVATSAQAMSPVPLHQSDGMITHVRHACGAGMHMVNGVCTTTVMRRQARRCLVWGAGHVCRKWG